ncbi:MAG: hypothetical protein C0611_10440 [Desulfobacteraceae bacterium]|nr:MAG: hypothetical protein C0611_10440 [Desulfobacteraceae bacterium]
MSINDFDLFRLSLLLIQTILTFKKGPKVKCPKCKFENREGVKFCEECGAKFELVCPVCKANIPLGRKFCGECG